MEEGGIMAATVPNLTNERYLGDAVYIGQDSLGWWVMYTSDGYEVTNKIVLEPAVVIALDHWRKDKA